jgi:type I restriction enzyme S subunit
MSGGRRWPMVRVGDLCKLVNGDAYKESEWSRSGTPIIRIQNLNDSTKPFNYWAGPVDGLVQVRHGDVLLAWSGTPGTSFGAHIWRGGEGVLNQHIFRVDLTSPDVTREWLVRSVNFSLQKLIARAHGAVGLAHVTKGEVQALEIPLPPISEQDRIAARLTAQLAAVERARAAV